MRRAANWSLVPEQRICETRLEAAGAELGAGAGQQTSLTLITDGCDNTASSVTRPGSATSLRRAVTLRSP